MKIINIEKRVWQWVILLFVSFVWGASFILMKKGLESYTPVQVGAMRIFFAFLFLLPFAFNRLKKFRKKQIKSLLIVAFFGNLFPAFLFAFAQTKVDSSMAGMLNAMFPIIAVIVGGLFYGAKTERHRIIGIVIAFGGSIGILLSGAEGIGGFNYYSIFILLATVFYAFSLNEMKHKLKGVDGITVTIFAFMIVGPLAGLYLLFSDFSSALATPDYLENLAYIVLLALGGSALAVSLFYWLTAFVDITFVSLTTYIIPIFAIFWGIGDGEIITFEQVLFMIVVFIGIYLVNRKKKKYKDK